MVTRLDPKLFDATSEITWCAGCGDFAILKALKLALADLAIEPHQALMVSGIGCGSKLPDYMTINGYMTIHGRPLPVATAAKLANPELTVIVVNGDGDSYGIGGNHFVQSCRRNPNLTQIVENNQIYGLTKGQYSPTSDKGFITTTSPDGSIEPAFNPMAVALAAGATFIARSFATGCTIWRTRRTNHRDGRRPGRRRTSGRSGYRWACCTAWRVCPRTRTR